MKILFLDQSGKPGGAELCLLDIAKAYRDRCLVCLFSDGAFRTMLEEEQIPVKVLATSINYLYTSLCGLHVSQTMVTFA